MGRLPRRNLGAGVYHIYNRCANNLWILDSPECKDKFLELLERLSGKYELNIYHYCVMSNHFHIAAEGNMKNISSFVSGLSCQYSKFYHRGNFKTPQICQSALFFDLIKGAFFRLRIKLRRDKRLLPCR